MEALQPFVDFAVIAAVAGFCLYASALGMMKKPSGVLAELVDGARGRVSQELQPLVGRLGLFRRQDGVGAHARWAIALRRSAAGILFAALLPFAIGTVVSRAEDVPLSSAMLSVAMTVCQAVILFAVLTRVVTPLFHRKREKLKVELAATDLSADACAVLSEYRSRIEPEIEPEGMAILDRLIAAQSHD